MSKPAPVEASPHREQPSNDNRVTTAGLLAGVLAVSSAAVIIRLADAPALTVASLRLVLASLVMVPLALWCGGKQAHWIRRDVALGGLAAIFLAAHFASWIASLGHTSVASSVVLVTATPLMVSVASWALFRERVSARVGAGIALGIAGGAVIALGDWDRGTTGLRGDALALLGAASITGYYLVGRTMSGRVPLLSYLALVYSGAAVLLLTAAVATGAPLRGLPATTYGWIALLAIGPQLLGHSLINWSLGRLNATVVSLAVTAEPVIATALAALVLSEPPPLTSVLGGAAILGGVWVAVGRGRDAA